MSVPKKPPQEVLDFIKDRFEYDKDTGELWRELKGGDWRLVRISYHRGMTDNQLKPQNVSIRWNGKPYDIKPANIIWYKQTGEWPVTCRYSCKDLQFRWNQFFKFHPLRSLNLSWFHVATHTR